MHGRRQGRKIVDVPRNDAAPESDVYPASALAAAARFASSALTVVVVGTLLSGMSTIVVTPPAAAVLRRVREAFPVGAPWLVDMHVRIHEPGKDDERADVDA